MSKKKGGTVRFDREERESLIPSQPSSKKPGRVWGAPIEESDDTRNLTNDQMQTFQQRKMNEQDSVLDVLSKSVGTIKEIAIGIGNETDQHLELIEDIDSRVDKTSVRIRNTTRQVERTEKKASTGCMWFCIVFLLLGLIAISVAAAYT